MNEKEFIEKCLVVFPDLYASFVELEGYFHLQMEAFDYRTKEEIAQLNEDKVVEAFKLAELCYLRGTNQMKSAVDTSFAESITFGLDGKALLWAWKLCPESLKKLHIDFWGERSVLQRLGKTKLS